MLIASQRLIQKWMRRKAHCPSLELHALQHLRLDLFVLNVDALENAMRGPEVVVLEDPPHPVNHVRTQRDEVWDAPQERK